jgi:glycosyltransferase involved in cell wall biosynthesis
MTTPTVSVIMAAYKGAALVGETIDSVLSQTLQDFELVIVDDCSPDNTLEVLRGYTDPRITVIASPVNQGPVKTRNIAMNAARGRYLAGLDQDDICLPERLERQVGFLDAHPDVALVAAAADFLEEGLIRPGNARGPTTPALLQWRLHLHNALVWSSVMMRADVARQLDPITRPEMLFAEDFDLYHRIGRLGGIARIDEPLLHYRIHPGGVSKTYQSTMIANATRVLAEVYQPIFGTDADENARLVMLHVAEGRPVPDRKTFSRIGEIITALRGYLVEGKYDQADTVLVDRAISALWWRLVRTAIRAGKMSPRILALDRPKEARLADLKWGDILVSGMIGTVRRIA